MIGSNQIGISSDLQTLSLERARASSFAWDPVHTGISEPNGGKAIGSFKVTSAGQHGDGDVCGWLSHWFSCWLFRGDGDRSVSDDDEIRGEHERT